MVLRRKPAGYRSALPCPEDVELVAESSFSSLAANRHIKLPVYANAGIQEYWIADVEKRLLHVFRDPEGNCYRSEAAYSGDQTISPLACPHLVTRVGDIFQ